MDFGIFNLMGSREADKPAAQVFGEVAEQTKLADALGYTIAWFAEHHFSNYCLCASPLMMVAHCAAITKKIRLGTAVVVLPLYNPARLAAEIATADALSNGRLMLGIGAGYQPYEFERFGVDIAKNFEMTNEFSEILNLAFSRDFFSYNGKHYQMPETHIAARTVQKPLPIYVAGHTQGMFRVAARHGYRVLTSGRLGGAELLAEQYADLVAAFAAENVPLSRAHITVNRFACITDSREEGMRFAENARYQSRLASSLRRRKEVMQGTVLVDVPFPDEPPLETIYDDLLIGDVDTVAEKLVAEIRAAKPVHVCFSFKVGNTP
ncbi:MAG: LLM class flavin-dependent oxidoreductase, partial [Burkholderiales bacterium]